MRVSRKLGLEKFLLILGIIVFVFAFFEISKDKEWHLKLSLLPHPAFILLAVLLILSALYRIVHLPRIKEGQVRKIVNGFEVKVDSNHIIEIVFGKIQNVSSTGAHRGIVLPANTCFDDECIRDRRTALGAFAGEHFTSGIESLQVIILEEASKLKPFTQSPSIIYPVGSTIFLEKPLGSGYRLLITAITEFSEKAGFAADISSLIACLKGVFGTAGGRRLSELVMPVIGTGHGGVDFSTALSCIILASTHYMRSKQGCHIKKLTILVFDREKEKTGEVENIVRSIAAVL